MTERRTTQRQTGIVVAVTLSAIALAVVLAARHRSPPAAVPSPRPKASAAVLDDQSRNEAAQVMTCAAIQKAVDASMVFDRKFTIEPLEDGTSRLTTAALLNGRQVDISAVLQWDIERQAWELLEAYVGGAAVPVRRSQRDGEQ